MQTANPTMPAPWNPPKEGTLMLRSFFSFVSRTIRGFFPYRDKIYLGKGNVYKGNLPDGCPEVSVGASTGSVWKDGRFMP